MDGYMNLKGMSSLFFGESSLMSVVGNFVSQVQGGDTLPTRSWTLDALVILIYLVVTIAVGLWISKRQKGLEDYFLGGRNIPWGAALMSMIATEISAATFLGAPEQGYLRDMTYLQIGIGSILARIVLAFVFLGMFYRLRVFTVYEFLTRRFGVPTKNMAAGAFLLGRIFAGGSRLFIASLAVKVVTGMDFTLSILLLGCIAIVYTWLGGIKAVIWTDVIQAIILIVGAGVCVVVLLHELPMSFFEVIGSLESAHKLKVFGISMNQGDWLSQPYHFLPALFGGFVLTLATHGTDQSMIQRLLTCKDSFRGKLSLVSSGFLGLFVAGIFLFIGMLLFLLIQHLPENDALRLTALQLQAKGHTGDIFLHFILSKVPTGLAGLIIASVLASAMSSIDSELNAMSSTFVNDFYRPYFTKDTSEKHLMDVAKWGTLAFGVILMLMALAITRFYLANPQTDLLTIALGIMTLFYGALLGVFLVGLLTSRRGSTFSTLAGMILSILVIGFITNKQGILEILHLVDPEVIQSGFWYQLYSFKLAWPWFIVLGTSVTLFVALLGVTSQRILKGYRECLDASDPN